MKYRENIILVKITTFLTLITISNHLLFNNIPIFAGTLNNSINLISKNFNVEKPKYDITVGSSDVQNLRVPTLSYDDTSITLVWDKPEKYDNVSDYIIYQNGIKIGTARENFANHAKWADTYMKSFYNYYNEKNIDMVNVGIHSFTATNLKPDTEYKFSVIAVDNKGNTLGNAYTIKASTSPTSKVYNILDYGAKSVEKAYTSYDDKKNLFIEENTRAIQSAIDACSKGGKVVIPKGIFMSGALYLKSNITLELEKDAVLYGSPNVDHYDKNYLLYPYSTDTRSWALLNAYSSDKNAKLENIRIVGEGTINGNGWKYGTEKNINDDGSKIKYQKPQNGDPHDPKFYLPEWVKGKSTDLYNAESIHKSLAFLGSDSTIKARSNNKPEMVAYNTRPNLIVIRGAKNIYIGGITVTNPGFHTITILDSENITSNDVKYLTYDCNNGDGIEIVNSQNAAIFNNFFDTGDDSINFATGVGEGVKDTKQLPSDNIWIFNNFLRHGHGGAIAAGSHTGAGISNILVEDNVLNYSEIPFRFKSAPINGGNVHNILIRDCAVANAKQVFSMSTTYSDAQQSFTVEPMDTPAEFYNIDAYNITADNISKNTISLIADVDYDLPYKPWHNHHDIYFQDIKFTNVNKNLAKKSEELKGITNAIFYNVDINWQDIDREKDDTQATDYTAWGSIKTCKNLKFLGTTTLSKNALEAMEEMKVSDNIQAYSIPVEEDQEKGILNINLDWDSIDNKNINYIVETYIDNNDKAVDITGIIKNNNAIIRNLSYNTNYCFKVYAISDTGNKVLIATTYFNENNNNDPQIKKPENLNIKFSNTGYTWSTVEFSNAFKYDNRIRGYKFYVNGNLVKTIYNYELKNYGTEEKISNVIGRLIDRDSTVEIKAFTDSNKEFSYNTKKVDLPKTYEFETPLWTGKLNAKVEGTSIILNWEEPKSKSNIYGYRVYMDGKPIYTKDGDSFNHTNGSCTTKNLSFEVKNVDLSVDHNFKVEASDAWWKALDGTGPFHWTFSGPSVIVNAKNYQEIDKKDNQSIINNKKGAFKFLSSKNIESIIEDNYAIKSKIFWAGDSTVTQNNYKSYPQTGLGQGLSQYLKKDIIIINKAENGRSTKSFIDEGRLDEIDREIGKGDFLFIEFGHNDQKDDEERHTEAYGSYQDNLRKFVDVALKHDAHPVFITSLYRRQFKDDNTLADNTHGDYPQAMIDLGKELNVPVIDLCSLSKEYIEELGDQKSEGLFMNLEEGRYKNYPEGKKDNTHLNYEGAFEFAGIIADQLKKLGGIYSDILL